MQGFDTIIIFFLLDPFHLLLIIACKLVNTITFFLLQFLTNSFDKREDRQTTIELDSES